jgi:fluoride exporter
MTPASPFDVPVGPPRERVWDIALVIAAGGAIGGAARYALNLAIPGSDDGFPWHTFLENALGCLLMGVLMVLLLDVWPPNRYLRPFLGVGVLGGFTTFSTYTSEARALLQTGHGFLALQYVTASILAGLAGVWAGIVATRAITADRRRT